MEINQQILTNAQEEVTVVIVTLSAQTPLVHTTVPARKVIMEMAYCAKTVSRIITRNTIFAVTREARVKGF